MPVRIRSLGWHLADTAQVDYVDFHIWVFLRNASQCPFCDLGGVSPDEMALHVNSTHLDFLTTPECEVRDFLEDDEFGGGGDYSSIWEMGRKSTLQFQSLSREGFICGRDHF